MVRGLNFPSKELNVISCSSFALPPSGFNAIGPIHSSPTRFSLMLLCELLLPPQGANVSPEEEKS